MSTSRMKYIAMLAAGGAYADEDGAVVMVEANNKFIVFVRGGYLPGHEEQMVFEEHCEAFEFAMETAEYITENM